MYWHFTDNFNGTSLSASWEANGALATHTVEAGLGGHGFATSSLADGATESVYADTININTAETYSLKVLLNVDHKRFRGTYGCAIYNSDKSNSIQCTIDLSSAAGEFDGTVVIDLNGDSETFTFDYTGGSAVFTSDERGWLDLRVTGSTIKVYWRGELIVSETATKLADDYSTFSIQSTCSDSTYACRIGLVEFNAVVLQNVGNPPPRGIDSSSGIRTMLVASAGGNLYREINYGEMTRLPTNLTLRDDANLQAVQLGQKLYIADYGDLKASGSDGTLSSAQLSATSIADWSVLSINLNDDVVVVTDGTGDATDGAYTISGISADYITLSSDPGDGTCSYRVERGPKIYDPIADTLTLWTASAGQVPTGCPLIARFLGRILLAGADAYPHAWYACATNDPTDWDYSLTPVTSAQYYISTTAGTPGHAITAVIVHRDDYVLFACRQQLWLLRGDPGYGGSFNSVSRDVGVISPNAWCLTPAGEVVFLSTRGLYVLAVSGGEFSLSPLSRDILPEELMDVDVESFWVSMAYDFVNDGVHVFLVAKDGESRSQWYIDWPTKTFWRMSYTAEHEPVLVHNYQCDVPGRGGLLLGGRDGYLRQFKDDSVLDVDSSFESYVYCGPVPLAQEGYIGRVLKIEGTTDGESSQVTWALMPATTYQGTVTASVTDTGTLSEGLNAPAYPACRGQALVVKLSGDSASQWSLEEVLLTVRPAGPRRLA